MEGSARTIWTVGHSNLRLEAFLDLVREMDLLADVRRYPASAKSPHFSGASLAKVKAYQWFPDLGGRRRGKGERHPAWRVAGFRAYAEYMETDPFRRALSTLERESTDHRTAILCAEALWWRCHRRLISDALVVRGWQVLHLPEGRPHGVTPFARIEDDGTLVYDRTGSDSPH